MKIINKVMFPEIGDVWQVGDGSKLYIINANNSDEYIVLANDCKDIWIVNMRFISEDYIYVGKSKAKISDLFEVKDEN